MSKKTVFKGAAVAITTPFGNDGKIDYNVFEQQIEYQISNKTDAIVVCGTTGEASTLSDEEHKELIRFTVEKVNKRVPVIAGTGSNETSYALELSEHALQAGADAILVVTPYYNKTTQKGIIEHYTYIANRVNLPMILYNVPSRTGLNILPQTYKILSMHPNIVATKEANGNVASVAQTRYLCGDELDIYSGEDTMITPMLSLGAKGVISVLSNIMPKQTHDICSKFFNGDCEGSAGLQIELIELINALFIETNPIPVKTALNLMEQNVGGFRLPLTSMTEANLKILKEQLELHGLYSQK